MEILDIELWDPLVEFCRDLRDTHYYKKVCRPAILLNIFKL